MTAKSIEAAVLPAHLSRSTVANLGVESPRYVPPDYILLNRETGQLYLRGGDLCLQNTQDTSKLLGRVGIMNASIIDAETNDVTTGYVADLRFIDTADGFSEATSAEEPSNPERREAWEAAKQQEIPIAAVTYEGLGTGEVVVSGDVRFAKAALHLAGLADTPTEASPTKEPVGETSLEKYQRTGILA